MSVYDLTGRKALVTGGGRGLGEGMAQALARAGAAVVIGDIREDLGKATAAPARASARAIPSPSPRAPPVTRAFLPVRSYTLIEHLPVLSRLRAPSAFAVTAPRALVGVSHRLVLFLTDVKILFDDCLRNLGRSSKLIT